MPQVVGCSDGFERFDSVQAVAEVILFDFGVVADLEVEPEPVGGAEVAGDLQLLAPSWSRMARAGCRRSWTDGSTELKDYKSVTQCGGDGQPDGSGDGESIRP